MSDNKMQALSMRAHRRWRLVVVAVLLLVAITATLCVI